MGFVWLFSTIGLSFGQVMIGCVLLLLTLSSGSNKEEGSTTNNYYAYINLPSVNRVNNNNNILVTTPENLKLNEPKPLSLPVTNMKYIGGE